MVSPIFKNPQQQAEFDRDGFLKIRLLSKQNIEDLNRLFANYFPNPSKDFFSSSYENDFQKKKKISDEIGKIITPSFEKIFTEYKWFGSAFLSKGNGPRSEMPMHQDWTIVDETKHIALNIWTPLQDTNEENGTLEVIKGSHKWHQALRAPTLPFYFEGHQSFLKEHLTVIPALATEAVILNQAIIHYSKANKTEQTRIAITSGLKSKNAPLIFHYWNKDEPNLIEQFQEEDHFLLQFTDFHQSIFKRPVIGKSIGKKAFQLIKASETDLQKFIHQNKIKRGLGAKLIQWLKN